jgi:hypothetical protein
MFEETHERTSELLNGSVPASATEKKLKESEPVDSLGWTIRMVGQDIYQYNLAKQKECKQLEGN